MSIEAIPVQKLEIREAFAYGWRKLMERPGLWVAVTIAGMVASAAVNLLARETSAGLGATLMALASFVVWNGFTFVLVSMALNAVRGEEVVFPNLGERVGVLVTYLAATFLYGLGVAIGLVLLIVPGIMFAVAYFFYGFVVVDTGADPLTALRQARVLSRGRRWALLGAGLVGFLVMLLGAMAFVVGLLLAIPVVTLAEAHIYRQLGAAPIAE